MRVYWPGRSVNEKGPPLISPLLTWNDSRTSVPLTAMVVVKTICSKSMGRLRLPLANRSGMLKSLSPAPLPKISLTWASCAHAEQLMTTKKIMGQTHSIRLVRNILQNPTPISRKDIIQGTLRLIHTRWNSTKLPPDRTKANPTLSFLKDPSGSIDSNNNFIHTAKQKQTRINHI